MKTCMDSEPGAPHAVMHSGPGPHRVAVSQRLSVVGSSPTGFHFPSILFLSSRMIRQ